MLAVRLALYPAPAQAFSGDTIEAVRKRGHILCGVSEGTPGFSTVDGKGQWSGLDIDFCRALAAAVLGDKDKVKFRPLSETDRFRAIKEKEVDVLARSTGWTLSRDTELGIRFAGVLFHDGQSLLVRRSMGISSTLELSGASICALSGSGGEQSLSDYFRVRQMRYQPVTSKRGEDLVQAYIAERCTVLSGDLAVLALERSRLHSPGDHVLLPEIISKEPKGPAVADGDEQWFSLVRWVLMSLIAAEELGLTSANVDEARASPLAEVQRFMGLDGELGAGIGLVRDWAYQVIKQTGNYGEQFDRNLGAESALKLDRGYNDIWTRGGLMFAPPFR